MNRTSSGLSMSDRLRIERAVWTLDSHLGDLPPKSKRAKRHETRANLHAAAADVGTTEAVRGLGNLRQLAADYLAAEYGEWGPRPSYSAGFVCLILVQAFAWGLIEAGRAAFTAGILAADPDATGTFVWRGIPYLCDDATFTLADGATTTSVGGGYTPLVYIAPLLGLVLAGRFWRFHPRWRR